MTTTPASAAPRGRLSCSLALSTFCLGVALGAAGPAAVQGALADAAADEAACETETDPARGIAACARVIEALGRPGPDDAWAFVNRGLSYKDAGDYSAALLDFTRAVQIAPRGTLGYYHRARLFHDLAEYDRALEDIDWALRLDAADPDLYNLRGMVFTDTGRYEEAETQFRASVKLDGSEKFYRNNLAVALTELGKYPEALAELDATLELDPEYGNAIVNRGVALACLGRRGEAMEAFELALRLYPDRAVIANVIAWKLSKSDKPGFRGNIFPLDMARRAVELDDWHGFRDTLAAALANAGQFDEAVAEEQRAIAMAEATGQPAFRAEYERRLARYRQGEVLVE